jgi:hypothetical protein
MKGFWERTRRLSNSMSIHSHHGGGAAYQGLRNSKGGGVDDDGVVLLNLDFKDLESELQLGKDMELESPVSTCGRSVEGFDFQKVVGGCGAESGDEGVDRIKSAIRDIEVAGDSSSDEDRGRMKMGVAETRPLVRA